MLLKIMCFFHQTTRALFKTNPYKYMHHCRQYIWFTHESIPFSTYYTVARWRPLEQHHQSFLLETLGLVVHCDYYHSGRKSTTYVYVHYVIQSNRTYRLAIFQTLMKACLGSAKCNSPPSAVVFYTSAVVFLRPGNRTRSLMSAQFTNETKRRDCRFGMRSMSRIEKLLHRPVISI